MQPVDILLFESNALFRIEGVKRQPKVICHVFESEEASFIAQSIGQAFQVAPP